MLYGFDFVPSLALDYKEREMKAVAFCLSLTSDSFSRRLNKTKHTLIVSLPWVLNLLTEGLSAHGVP